MRLPSLALLCNTLPTGAILTVLILTFGPVSGAHFNPAVSIALALRRELPPGVAAMYIVAQILGAIVGVLAAHAPRRHSNVTSPAFQGTPTRHSIRLYAIG